MISHNLDQGRAGNKLFQIAACIGTAAKHGYTWGVPRWEWSDYFVNEHPLNVPTENYFQENGFHFTEISVPDSTRISGYFQSQKYFVHAADQVKEAFRLKPELIARVREKFGFLLDMETCAIHVRRGDYVTNRNHLVLPTSYYVKAMQMLPGKTFLVFSDDIEYCRKMFNGNVIFVKGQSDIEDFALMTLLKNHIIANSSFSWWSAWLSEHKGKRVIAPLAWFGPGLKRTHNTKDLIPGSWLRV